MVGAAAARVSVVHVLLRVWFFILMAGTLPMSGADRTNAVLVELEGKVLVARAGATTWDPGRTNQPLFARDQVRTYERSRAVIRLSNLSTWRVAPNTILQIPEDRQGGEGFQLLKGLLFYFHRDKPGTMPIRTPTAYATILGTEFTVAVGDDGATRIDVIDGRVELTNAFGALTLLSGEAALANRGAAPVRTLALRAVNVVQWALYYPAVLDLAELRLPTADSQRFAESADAYRQGDLRRALGALPDPIEGESPEGRVFRSALLLSAGEVASAERMLDALAGDAGADRRLQRLVESVRTLIAAVRYEPGTGLKRGGEGGRATAVPDRESPGATALLAESYLHQARRDLGAARDAARRATRASPEFGYAWARLAELEFSFGDRAGADRALDEALRQAPRNAAAHVLRGFTLAAANRVPAALAAFEEALALDGALGDAWLGRGLCRIRMGDAAGGRDDLQVAATVEPQRAALRSYLGKAFGHRGDSARARRELDLARGLDPLDPTAWLYSALLNWDSNRVNTALRELEHARTLNGGRQVYRSEVLLDQDAAAQGVNLAGLYADAGLQDWSVREAGRAVQLDPANASAHLFLGDAYQRQRDPGRVSQRFETPAIAEYLLANLLSPIGAGSLAQTVTHNEYSKLFVADGPGFYSATEYLSRGAWEELAAHYGTLGNSSYALSGYYRTDPGQRANHASEQHEVSFQFKQQLTPADSVYLRVIRGGIDGGDLRALQDPRTANRTLSVREEQEPLLLAGYHREWSPGSHTLALMGWLSDQQELTDGQQGTWLLNKVYDGTNVSYALPVSLRQDYHARVGLFTAELQQLWQRARHALIAGGRYQDGGVTARNAGSDSIVPDAPLLNGFPTPAQRLEADLVRAGGYGYYQLEAAPSLLLVGGLSYDWMKYPDNFRFAPLSRGEADADQVSPKAGAVWSPARDTTVRAAYAQALGGAGFDQSFRLEPTQVAGFNQAFRSLIPESVAGANAAARFETWNAALEQRLGRDTYLGLSLERLHSEVGRTLGVYDYGLPLPSPPVANSTTRERLDFTEHTAVLAANQLVGDDWSFGVRYRVSHAELRSHLPAIPHPPDPPTTVPGRTETEAVLHQVNLFGAYHHPSGFFGLAEALWSGQINHGSVAMGADDFWQLNAHVGWRGWRRRVEVRAGMLNITDRDYRLNPLNLTRELPRERTFVAACRLTF